jgi:hypothetical protein
MGGRGSAVAAPQPLTCTVLNTGEGEGVRNGDVLGDVVLEGEGDGDVDVVGDVDGDGVPLAL